MIAVVVKWGDVKRARASTIKPEEVTGLKKRLSDLEIQLHSFTTQVLELQEEHDFAKRLLDEKQSASSN